VVVATAAVSENPKAEELIAACRRHLPLYMLPAKVEIRSGTLPRNPNGKIDRASLAAEFRDLFERTPT
jgi:acyl-CoA synthetase (AMP-forming)/AMP-acid ligase II